MSLIYSQHIHMLSCLAAMGLPRTDRSQLVHQLPRWCAHLKPPEEMPALTPRQQRRWFHLYRYWQENRGRLLNLMTKRGLGDAPFYEQLNQLSDHLAPPLSQSEQAYPARQACHALFITQFPWGEYYGDTRPLTLRQIRFEKHTPPFHLSAWIKGASILAAGNLAIEALSRWLEQHLDSAQRVPLWVEAAFPDDIRLTDESASLAFVAATLQGIFSASVPSQAFSGLVKRDTGHIEQVQGFDLPYGKLEAAFDQGIQELFLPPQTPINVLPRAGICLKQISAHHFRYFLESEPADSMDIFYTADLEALFQAAIARHQTHNKLSIQAVRNHISAQLLRPDFRHWQHLQQRLAEVLPAELAQRFADFLRAYQRAFEFEGALPDSALLWQQPQDAMAQFLQQLFFLLGSLGLTPVLGDLPWRQKQAAVQTLLQHWLTLPTPQDLQALCQLMASASQPAEALNWLTQQHTTLNQLLENSLRQASTAALAAADYLWNQVLLLQTLFKTPTPFEQLQLLSLEPQASGAVVGRLRSGQSGDQTAVPEPFQADSLLVWQRQTAQFWRFPFLALSADSDSLLWPQHVQTEHTLRFVNQPERSVPWLCAQFPARLYISRSFPGSLHQNEQTVFCAAEYPLDMQLRIQGPTGFVLNCTDKLPEGVTATESLLASEAVLAVTPLDYTFQLHAEQADTLSFRAPEVQLKDPDGQLMAEVDIFYESPAVKLLSDKQASLSVVRCFSAEPSGLKTHQRFQMHLEITNHSRVSFSGLRWKSSDILPAGCQHLASVGTLPEKIAPFSRSQLQWELLMPVAGEHCFAELQLDYQHEQGHWLSQTCPALTAHFAFQGSGQLFGRQAETAWFSQWLKAEQQLAVYLSGEAGAGKQFLARHVARQHGFAYFAARITAPFDFAYAAAKEVLRQLLGCLQHLHSGLWKAPEHQVYWQLLTALATGQLATEQHPRDLQEQIYRAFEVLLLQLANRQPLLLGFHETEHMDAESCALLGYLLTVLPLDLPVRFVLTGQKKLLPLSLRSLQISRRHLEGLDESAFLDWVSALFAVHRFPEGFLQQIYTETRGNPLFIHELLRYFQSRQQIRYQAGVWIYDPAVDIQGFPDSLEALFSCQLHDFRPEAELFNWLAVTGENTPFALLLCLSGLSEEQLEEQLERLLQQQLLQETKPDCFSLEPPLLGKYLYSGLPARKARRLHLKTAEALLALQPPSQTAELEKLAFHFAEARQFQAAFTYALQCGRAYWQQGLLQSARPWLKKALSLVAELAEELLLATKAELFYYLGYVSQYTDDLEQACSYYRQGLYPEAPLAFAIRIRLALAQLVRPQEAADLFETSLSLCQPQATETDMLRGEVLLALGRFQASQGLHTEAQASWQTALQLAPENSLLQAELLEVRSYAVIKQGQQAEADLLKSKAIYQQHQDHQGLALVNSRLGACCFYQQALDRAEHYFLESLSYYIQTGNQLKQAHVQHNLGLLHESQKQDAKARQYYLQNLEISRRIKYTEFEGYSALQLASLALRARELTQAQDYLALADTRLSQSSEKRAQGYLGLHQGLYWMLHGDLQQAEKVLLAAESVLTALADVMGMDRARMRLGHCYWLQGQSDRARVYYQQCLETRQQLDPAGQDGLERAWHAWGMLAGQEGDLPAARAALLKAYALLAKGADLQSLAIVTHNLALTADSPEQALQYHKERDTLCAMAEFPLKPALESAVSLFPILDD